LADQLETHLENAFARRHPPVARRPADATAAGAYRRLLLAQGEQRKTHYEHFRRRLDLCQQLGIPTLLVVADFTEAVDDSRWARRGFAKTGRSVGRWFNVRLALEFRSTFAVLRQLDTALALVAPVSGTQRRRQLDVFPLLHGTSKFEDLGLLTPGNLAFVQLSDLSACRASCRGLRPHFNRAMATFGWCRS